MSSCSHLTLIHGSGRGLGEYVSKCETDINKAYEVSTGEIGLVILRLDAWVDGKTSGCPEFEAESKVGAWVKETAEVPVAVGRI